jgi:dihydropteroate synthase
MGIVNVTPDSFSGDGLAGNAEAALAQATAMVEAGADLIDVGGESTRPGSAPIDQDEELARVIPAVGLIASRLDVPISVDTSRAEVARQALEAGASMVNDVRGLQADPTLPYLAAQTGAWVVLVHNRAARASVDDLGGHYPDASFEDVVGEVREELAELAGRAEAAGVRRERLVLDPGLGFGKSYRQNLELIRRLGELKSLGLPLLVGASRKSFTGRAQRLPVDQRLEPSLAALTLCIEAGADVVRVHDVVASVRAARFADEVVRSPRAR